MRIGSECIEEEQIERIMCITLPVYKHVLFYHLRINITESRYYLSLKWRHLIYQCELLSSSVQTHKSHTYLQEVATWPNTAAAHA